jgi:hypothetical protein
MGSPRFETRTIREALIPINRAGGDGIGVIGNLHLFLKDVFSNSMESRLLPQRQESIQSAD